jgi:uncharacterized protein (DUF1330 family)
MQRNLIVALCAGAMLGAVATHTIAQARKPVPAFYIAQHEVHDPATMGIYGNRVPATLAPFGGRFLARGGKVATLEGDPPTGRIVVIAFESMEKAQAWYDSPAYKEIKPIRLKAAKSRAFVVEGLPE